MHVRRGWNYVYAVLAESLQSSGFHASSGCRWYSNARLLCRSFIMVIMFFENYSLFQGNVADFHVKLMLRLQNEPDTFGGEVFFALDDMKVTSHFHYIQVRTLLSILLTAWALIVFVFSHKSKLQDSVWNLCLYGILPSKYFRIGTKSFSRWSIRFVDWSLNICCQIMLSQLLFVSWRHSSRNWFVPKM